MYKILLLSISILIFSGCLSTEINIATYKQSINIKENIPQVCKSNFKQTKPTVAVVNFTNNSTFGTAKISTNNSDASIGLFGFSLGASSNKTNTIKTVEPKLAKAFIPLIEKMILDTGGTELFTRTDLDKVDTELKLQDSGLLDPSSIVEFGLNSGVEYIITGSIDYVEHNFKNYSKTTGTLANATYNTDNTNLKLAATGLHFISSLFDGTT
ncbi:MAG: hypothetical protein KAJ49_10250, partial [Arcobacteraceae bacterium]|nr:hypothetical protein [Arcobacteraceae bacterium]